MQIDCWTAAAAGRMQLLACSLIPFIRFELAELHAWIAGYEDMLIYDGCEAEVT